MLKLMVTLALGAVLLLASAVWSGTVLQSKLTQLERLSVPEIRYSGPEMGAARFVP